jgi:anti-sigma factor RsiW
LNCREIETLIHGYADGELDLVQGLEIERHLQECPSCAGALAGLQSVRAAIRDNPPYFQAPPGLARRVRSSLREAGPAARPALLGARRLLAVTASAALIAAAGWGLARVLPARPDDADPTRELVASHVRSQMLPSHQFDVESTDAHTVKPWFEGKLDFAPPVKDLAAQGFPLIGGRLDYLRDRPVAALVYRRRKHPIDLFIWPSPPGPEAAPARATRQGYHMVGFSHSGMTYWAVSDLNEPELEEFVRLIRG